MTYEEAISLLGNKDSKNLKKTATKITKNGDNIQIYYHDTPVVTITPENDYIINTGGYHTKTTKARISEFSPVQIVQRNYKWFVYPENIEFVDGMTFDRTGKIRGEEYYSCWHCDGSGEIKGSECSYCDGSGETK